MKRTDKQSLPRLNEGKFGALTSNKKPFKKTKYNV
jgi:hypothetical protein